MKLITRNDIENWVERNDSKGFFPNLISKLIRATTPPSTQIDFPSGSTVSVGGWDGVVICHTKTAYVPMGKSLWELGTKKSPNSQAEENYVKRTKDSLGHDISQSTFVFVTGRFWSGKRDWQQEKIKEGKWGNIVVYDSSDIEQWLEIAEYVLIWFANYLGKVPIEGIDIAEQYWQYWSEFRDLKLSPEIITSGRKKEQEEIYNFLEGFPNITSVKAASKDEAIAFILASAKLFPNNESERFFSRTLIVKTEAAYKSVAANINSPFVLIPTFENKQSMFSAVSNNHHVIVPLGADDEFDKNSIILPTIDRNGQINGLISSGFSENDAKRFSIEAGRNITILKKLIDFPHSKSKWFDKGNIGEIIPALLLGRWNENFAGDIELLEKLSGQEYANYSLILNKWINFEESPLIQIGSTWRLTSPLNLWTTLSSYLRQQDLKNIQDCFSIAFKDGNPTIEPEDKNDFAALFCKREKYSNWARKGLTQSLILIGRFSEKLNIQNHNPQLWVDSIILDLLYDASGEIWISVNDELPLIAEASPVSFLKSVSNSLSKESPEIMDMFKEEKDFFNSKNNYTGLLWALESLAWFPEYLREASLILLKLSRLDPGGNLSNRPINSISEIFKPWHFQTLASYSERMEILKNIVEKEKEMGWLLLIKMLPDKNGIAHPTYKMRWKIFDKNTHLSYTYQEIWNTHTFVVELLLNLFDYTEEKFSQLIDESVSLAPNDRKRIWDWADITYSKVQQKDFITWETIRKILNHHRSYSYTDWALPEKELRQLEKLYKKLKPKDVIKQFIWFFDYEVVFPEGFKYDETDHKRMSEEMQIRNEKARDNATKTLLKKLGLQKTLELRKSVKTPSVLGSAMAQIITNQEDVFLVCECLNDEEKYLEFIHNFILRKSVIEGIEWIKNLITTLQQKGFNEKAISNVLIPIKQTKELWEYISSLSDEIEYEYWHNIFPNSYSISDDDKVLFIEMLMKYKRFFSAIYICALFENLIPSNIIVELLIKTATEDANEAKIFNSYDIGRLFKTLDKRTDIDKSVLLQIEWLYLPLLDSNRSNRNPKILHEELSQNPEFFIEVLKWVYKPKDEGKIEEERNEITDDLILQRAEQAYHLLHSWKKIPGMKSDNSIDKTVLQEWINKVRQLAEEQSRLEVADMKIGQILAEYPENVEEWPQEIIFQIIEDINTDDLKRNYSAAMFNKRGASMRGTFEGGNIERGKAAYFEKLANDTKIKYPNVSDIFKHLEQGYITESKRMDQEAELMKLEY